MIQHEKKIVRELKKKRISEVLKYLLFALYLPVKKAFCALELRPTLISRIERKNGIGTWALDLP